MQLLERPWATGDTRKVAEGALQPKTIWGEHGDFERHSGPIWYGNRLPEPIQEKGMLKQ